MINPPPVRDVITSPAWLVWFGSIYDVLGAKRAGSSDKRPDRRMVIGQMYFDTDLGRPVWWDGSAWVDSGGAPA